MSEKTIEISKVDPLDLFGVNDKKLKLIRSRFPELKLVSRGGKIKAIGEAKDIAQFEVKLNLLIQHLTKFKELSENNIERLLEADKVTEDLKVQMQEKDEVLFYGNHGLLIKARTFNQRKLVKSVDKHDMIFALGPAGTGKTYTAVALAARALKNKEVRKIILCRPAVEAGENLGFLPGDVKEKLDPYLQPLYDALHDMFPAEKLNEYMENGVVQIAPLAYMRGRTLDNAFVILDEAQNASRSQFKMFLTRMGKNAKFLVTGDASQVDLPSNQPSGLLQAMQILKNTKGIDFIHFDGRDVIRHALVKKIIDAYDMIEKNKAKSKEDKEDKEEKE
ncbi:MAG: phosphate starvation-inducible protein PhoH [Flavobacteriales bacterium]|nr:phosphate starvation-inducible protein PhoH [Flavobacteriales bacterium]